MKKARSIIFFSCLLFFSCKKDTKEPEIAAPADKGNLNIEFDNKVDSLPLVFNTKYLNANGDTFTVKKFNYYISNIVLTNSDNSTLVVPDSYYLVKHSDASSRTITLTLPPGSYKSIKLMLGVDSARNVSGAQTGALSPATASDMFWGWSSGYIFLKLEGKSSASGDPSQNLEYHIGGHGGINKAQRSFDLGFGNSNVVISKDATSLLSLNVNVSECFRSPVKIDVRTRHTIVTAGSEAKLFADNYADMISFGSVKN